VRSKKLKPFAWRPVAIYIGVVLVAGTGLILWDRAYEARLSPSVSIQPETVAKNLVEAVMGAGTVQSATLDRKTGRLTMVVKDTTDKAKSPAQTREQLSQQGSGAVEGVLRMVAFKQMVLQFVRDGKVLATVRGEPGKPPQTEFASELFK